MALIATQNIATGGQVVTMSAAASGDQAEVGSNRALVLHNTDSSSHTVTIAVPGATDYGPDNPDRAVVLAAGEYAVVPLLSSYRDGTSGYAELSYTATTGVKHAVVYQGQ